VAGSFSEPGCRNLKIARDQSANLENDGGIGSLSLEKCQSLVQSTPTAPAAEQRGCVKNSVIAWSSEKSTFQNGPGSTIGIAGGVR